MMRRTRGLLAQVFVVLAIAALASVALAPRGMLRAAVADDLDLGAATAEVDGAGTIDHEDSSVVLPGVRALVSREEQDAQEALRDALATPPAPSTAAPARTPGPVVEASVAAPPLPAPSAENGDRAPPSSI
ncbi:MAG TPA: hypothetical protein VGE43_09005 [Acidimicrobiales bacterium]